MSELRQRLRFRRDHRWAPGRMSAYLDGELGSGSRARMERHTEACAQCRRLLEGLRRMLVALRGLPAPGDGADVLELAATVRQRLPGPSGSSE